MDSTGRELPVGLCFAAVGARESKNQFFGGQFFGHIGMKMYSKIGTFGIDGWLTNILDYLDCFGLSWCDQ